MLPKEEPLRLRDAFRRWDPIIQTPAMESRIPAARPGKKPARTAVVGNLLHAGEINTGVLVAPEDSEAKEDEVADGFDGEVADDVGELGLELELDADAGGPGMAF